MRSHCGRGGQERGEGRVSMMVMMIIGWARLYVPVHISPAIRSRLPILHCTLIPSTSDSLTPEQQQQEDEASSIHSVRFTARMTGLSGWKPKPYHSEQRSRMRDYIIYSRPSSSPSEIPEERYVFITTIHSIQGALVVPVPVPFPL